MSHPGRLCVLVSERASHPDERQSAKPSRVEIGGGEPYNGGLMIEFHLDARSGVATYLQIVQQVKEALRLGLLDVGDQLPTVREVVADLAINPNTVAKAYRDLEREGLVVARPGRGTFIASTLAAPSLAHHESLRRELEHWLTQARQAGLDEESIRALISKTLREALVRQVA
jgi:DNA-binding transcriptional regulator YhcF (GntR family)